MRYIVNLTADLFLPPNMYICLKWLTYTNMASGIRPIIQNVYYKFIGYKRGFSP